LEKDWVVVNQATGRPLANSTSTGVPKAKHHHSNHPRSAIAKLWDGLKSSVSSLLVLKEPRTQKAAFGAHTTSSRPPHEILDEIQKVLTEKNISFYVFQYLVRCEVEDIQFELEICRPPRLSNFYFIHPNRIEGNEWKYKNILSDLLAQMKL